MSKDFDITSTTAHNKCNKNCLRNNNSIDFLVINFSELDTCSYPVRPSSFELYIVSCLSACPLIYLEGYTSPGKQLSNILA